MGRFVKLWATGILLFYAAWFAGYFLVPEGFLREIFFATRLPLEGGGAAAVGGRIILFNGVVASGLIVVANLFRITEFPLGYLPVLFHWSLFGVFLGSDSFAYSQGGRLFPTVAGIIGRIGFQEITAYTLIAAATTALCLFRQKSWTDWSTVRERSWRELRLARGEWLALALAVALIAYAGLREGAAIVALE